MSFSGLRVGEALALTWPDIDFENKQLTVNKNLSQTKNGYVVSSPKTKSSNRTISIDDKTVRTLKKMAAKRKRIALLKSC